MITLYAYPRISDLRKLLRARVAASSPRKVIFMLPTRRNEELLLDMLRVEGSYFGSQPTVWNWSSLYGHLTPDQKLRRCIDPPDHRLIMRFILDRTLESLDGRGITVPRGVRRNGFVEILSSAVRELLLEDIPPDMLLYTIEGVQEPHAGEEISSRVLLYRLYYDYLLYLEENGLTDDAQLPSLTRAALDDRLPEFLADAAVYWVGYLSFTGAQLKLLRALRDLGLRMEFFMPATGIEEFCDAAKQLDVEIENKPAVGGRIATLAAREMYDQFDLVAREVALAYARRGSLHDALRKSLDDEMLESALADIGIQADADRLQLIASALDKYGIPYQMRAETMASETCPIDLVRRAWEAYRANWPARRTWHLLLHPLLGHSRLDGERFLVAMPEGLDEWREFLSGNEAASASLERLAAFCSFIDDPEGHRPEELLEALLLLAAEDEWEATAAREAGLDIDMDDAVREIASARMEAREKLEILRELRTSVGEAGALRFSGSAAIGYLMDWSRDTRTMLSPLQEGVVTLYDALPPVLVSHRIWIMTDVDPSRYPGTTADEPLLGGDVRENVNSAEEAAHLPTVHEKRQQREALFRRLLTIGEDLTLLARSLFDAQGRPQGESPFLHDLFSPADGEPQWTHCCEIQEPDPCEGQGSAAPLHDPASVIQSAEQPVIYLFPAEARMESGRLYRGHFPRVAVQPADSIPVEEISGKIRVAPSSVDDWLTCPFLYWCRHIARVASPQDSGGIFDRAFQGTVMHKIWQSVWEQYVVQGGAPSGLSLHATLESQWDGLLASLAQENPALADRRSTAILARLRSAMADAADLQDEIEQRAEAAGFVREGISFEYALPTYELAHVVFSGKADRVDFWRGVGSVIVDYKLGRSDRYGESMQLASYAAIMRDSTWHLGSFERVAGFCYLGHADGRVRGAWVSELEPVYRGNVRGRSGDLEESVAAAAALLQSIDAAVARGEYPANYESEHCPRCSYPTLCRRAERCGARPQEGGDGDGAEAYDAFDEFAG